MFGINPWVILGGGIIVSGLVGAQWAGKLVARHERDVTTSRGEMVCDAAHMSFVEYAAVRKKGEPPKPLDRKRWGVQCAAKVAQLQAEHTDALNRHEASIGVSEKAGAQAVEHQTQIEWRTRTLKEKVTEYVPAQVDDATVVPVGFVRYLDDAAAGKDPAGVSFAAGRTFEAGAPSGIPLSTVARVVGGNYGQYHAVAAELTDLQAWTVKQHELK